MLGSGSLKRLAVKVDRVEGMGVVEKDVPVKKKSGSTAYKQYGKGTNLQIVTTSM